MIPYVLALAATMIRDFNKRPLTRADLERECDSRDICLYEANLDYLHGFTGVDKRGLFICLNRNLDEQTQLVAGFHELGHQCLHPVHEDILLTSMGHLDCGSRWEEEAEAVAIVAVCPHVPPVARNDIESARRRLKRLYGV